MNFVERSVSVLRAIGPDAALYGLSAARLHQLVLDDPDVVDVVVPWTHGPVDLPGVRVRRTRGEGRRPFASVPVPHTDIVETVLDLTDRTDPETCVHWLTEAVRRGLVTMPDLLGGLAGRRRHRHRALIAEVAQDVASGATSCLEVRYAKDVERAHGLPVSVRQFIVPTTGHRADFAYPDARLLIELDGIAYHSGDAAVRDAALDAAHATDGWLTRRYRWGPVVGTPCAVAQEVARLLRSAGVLVEAQPCRRELEAA